MIGPKEQNLEIACIKYILTGLHKILSFYSCIKKNKGQLHVYNINFSLDVRSSKYPATQLVFFLILTKRLRKQFIEVQTLYIKQ